MALTPMAFTPSDGLKNTLSFPTNPSSEADARKQIQDVLDQLKTGINLLETELQAETASSLLGAVVGGVASNIQAFIDIVEAAGVGSLPPSGSVTNPMMATDVKIGSLAELTFGDKSSITYSLNLIYSAVEILGALLALNVTTGSANTYIVTYNPAKTSYSQSYTYALKTNFSNTGSSTLEFNSLGAKTIKKVTAAGLVDLVANDIISGGFYLFTYNGTYMVLLNPSSSLERVLTTQGDMVYASAANTPARLAKGTAYQALGMNSGATAQQWMASLQSLMTAAGDIVVATGANTPARLAVGSTGQVLGVSGGVPVWENPEWVLMETQTTASSATSVTFSTLGSYDVFKIVIMGCFDSGEDMLLRFNADSTNKYKWTKMGTSAGSASSETNSGGSPVSAINLNSFFGSSSLKNGNYMELLILPVIETNLYITTRSKNLYIGGSYLESTGVYEPASSTPLSSISLLRSSTSIFRDGTKIALYGNKLMV